MDAGAEVILEVIVRTALDPFLGHHADDLFFYYFFSFLTLAYRSFLGHAEFVWVSPTSCPSPDL